MKTLKIANIIALMLLFTPFFFVKMCESEKVEVETETTTVVETTDSTETASIPADSVNLPAAPSLAVSETAETTSFWQILIMYDGPNGIYITGFGFVYGFCSSLVSENLSDIPLETTCITLSFCLYLLTLVKLIRKKYAYLPVLYSVIFLAIGSTFGYYLFIFRDSEDRVEWGFYLYLFTSLFLAVQAFRVLPFAFAPTRLYPETQPPHRN